MKSLLRSTTTNLLVVALLLDCPSATTSQKVRRSRSALKGSKSTTSNFAATRRLLNDGAAPPADGSTNPEEEALNSNTGTNSSILPVWNETSAFCADHPDCAHLEGACCPTQANVTLSCCLGYQSSMGDDAFVQPDSIPDEGVETPDEGAETPEEAAPTVEEGDTFSCPVCGDGQEIINPDDGVDIPGFGRLTCGSLQDADGALCSAAQVLFADNFPFANPCTCGVIEQEEAPEAIVITCPVCGQDEEISNPDDGVDIPGFGRLSCGSLQDADGPLCAAAQVLFAVNFPFDNPCSCGGVEQESVGSGAGEEEEEDDGDDGDVAQEESSSSGRGRSDKLSKSKKGGSGPSEEGVGRNEGGGSKKSKKKSNGLGEEGVGRNEGGGSKKSKKNKILVKKEVNTQGINRTEKEQKSQKSAKSNKGGGSGGGTSEEGVGRSNGGTKSVKGSKKNRRHRKRRD